MTYTSPESVIKLESIGCRLLLRDLYDKVEFPAAESLRAEQA